VCFFHLCLHCVFTLHSVFTLSSLCLHCVFTVSSRCGGCLYSVFTLSSLCLHCVFTVSYAVFAVCSESSPSLHCVFTVYSLCLGCFFTRSSLCLSVSRCVFTLSSLCPGYVFITSCSRHLTALIALLLLSRPSCSHTALMASCSVFTLVVTPTTPRLDCIRPTTPNYTFWLQSSHPQHRIARFGCNHHTHNTKVYVLDVIVRLTTPNCTF
jgi:hypothetical protein